MSRARRWCFTYFFEDPADLPTAKPEGIDFLVFGWELTPGSLTPHAQGYVEWTNPATLAHCRAFLDANWLVCKGNQAANIAYCTKDGDWVEFGTRKAQGARTDLLAVKTLLDAGEPIKRIADDHFSDFVRYERGFKSYKRMIAVKRSWPMSIIIYVGPTGTGKTKAAHDTYPDAYWKPKGKWWDNYDGQETVVIDEMYGSSFAFTELLQLMDRYPLSVETKGGTVEFNSKRLIFTSNEEPEDWYDSEKTHRMAWKDSPLNRRIKEFGVIVRTGEVHRRVRPQVNQPQFYGGSFQ